MSQDWEDSVQVRWDRLPACQVDQTTGWKPIPRESDTYFSNAKSVPEARRKGPSDCSKTSRPGRGPKRSHRVAPWVLWRATVRRIFLIISVGRGSIMPTTNHRRSELRATNYPPSVTSTEASQRLAVTGVAPLSPNPHGLPADVFTPQETATVLSSSTPKRSH